jgi:hypothetical protein
MKAPLQTRPKTSSTAAATFATVQRGLLQRKCACGGTPGPSGECESCRRKRLQRAVDHPSSSTPHLSEGPPIVQEVLRSPGQPLDRETRAFMEPRFGHDFSRVRVRTGARAAESAQAVNAWAYTVGQDIVFGGGRYAPETTAGKKLLAHELSHTLQQSSAGERGPMLASSLRVSQPDDAHEREADLIAARVVGSSNDSLVESAVDSLAAAPTSLIQRQGAEEKEEPQDGGDGEREPGPEERGEEEASTEAQTQEVAPGESQQRATCPVQRRGVPAGSFVNFVTSPFNVNSGCSRVAIHLTAQWQSIACCDPGPTYRIEVQGPTPHNANMRAGITGLAECTPTRAPQADVTTFRANPGRYTLKIFGTGDSSCGRLRISSGHVQVS